MRLPFRLLLVVGVASTISCISSTRKLANQAVATAHYYEVSYEKKCQNTGGHFPPECVQCKVLTNSASWQAQVADQNATMGYMPPAEITELKKALEALGQCP